MHGRRDGRQAGLAEGLGAERDGVVTRIEVILVRTSLIDGDGADVRDITIDKDTLYRVVYFVYLTMILH